jgi:hypothetical protein
MPTILGRCIVWGIDGTMLHSGIVATSDNEPEALDYEETYKEHETILKDGEPGGLVLWFKRENLVVDYYPCEPAGAGSIANAKTNIELPAIGSKVTIAAMAGARINDTTWLYAGGGRIREESSNIVKMTLPLRQYGTDIAATANS